MSGRIVEQATEAGDVRRMVQALVCDLPTGDEPKFAAPWELRAFALAVAAFHGGQFQWNEFQDELIASIRTWEATDTADQWSYYERWLEALEALLAEKGSLTGEVMAQRTATVLAVPRDKDHHHAHRKPVAVSPAEA